MGRATAPTQRRTAATWPAVRTSFWGTHGALVSRRDRIEQVAAVVDSSSGVYKSAGCSHGGARDPLPL